MNFNENDGIAVGWTIWNKNKGPRFIQTNEHKTSKNIVLNKKGAFSWTSGYRFSKLPDYQVPFVLQAYKLSFPWFHQEKWYHFLQGHW